jgi:hypothetical protein
MEGNENATWPVIAVYKQAVLPKLVNIAQKEY